MPDEVSNLPVVLTQSGLSHLAGASLFEIRGTKDIFSKERASSFAISDDESLIALLGQKSVTSFNLGLLNNAVQVIDNRSKLVSPSIDPFNAVWTASATLGAPIRVTDVNGTQINLPNPYGAKGEIREIAVSQEGSRIAIIHGQSSNAQVDVFAIIRDKDRKVVSLGQPFTLTDFGPKPQSISWHNHTTIEGLETDGNGYQTAVSVVLGGPSTNGRHTTDAVSLVTLVGGSQYYLAKGGTLYSSQSFSWTPINQKVVALKMVGQ
jgi:hypothetical protein